MSLRDAYIARRVAELMGPIKIADRGKRQQKKCLGCGKEFLTRGHNRICGKCDQRPAIGWRGEVHYLF